MTDPIDWTDDQQVAGIIRRQFDVALDVATQQHPDLCTRFVAGSLILVLTREGLTLMARDVDVHHELGVTEGQALDNTGALDEGGALDPGPPPAGDSDR